MKNSVLIGKKNYISSRRASEITKYANDYIGQLCRGGKISAKKIGNFWFVDEVSLLDYKKSVDEGFISVASDVPDYTKKIFPVASSSVNSKLPWDGILQSNIKLAQLGILPSSLETKSKIKYYSDNRPLLPLLKLKTKADTNLSQFDAKLGLKTSHLGGLKLAKTKVFLNSRSALLGARKGLATLATFVLLISGVALFSYPVGINKVISVIQNAEQNLASSISDGVNLIGHNPAIVKIQTAGIFDGVGELFGNFNSNFKSSIIVAIRDFLGIKDVQIQPSNNSNNSSVTTLVSNSDRNTDSVASSPANSLAIKTIIEKQATYLNTVDSSVYSRIKNLESLFAQNVLHNVMQTDRIYDNIGRNSVTTSSSFSGSTGIFTDDLSTNGQLTVAGMTTTNLLAVNGSSNFIGQATFNNASTTNFSANNLVATTICLSSDCRVAWPSGGAAFGTWATTTSTVGGQVLNYSSNNSDIVAIGGVSTSSAKMWFDPNTNVAYFGGNVGIGTTSPFAKLSVAGGIVSDYINVTSATATSTFAGPIIASSVSVTSARPSKGLIIGDSTIAPYLGQNGIDYYLLTASDSLLGTTISNQAHPGDTIVQQQTLWTADSNKGTYDWIVVEVGLNDLDPTESAVTALARYQTLINTINAGKKSSAVVVVSTMTPLRSRLISLYGAVNGPIAYQKWLDMNTAIMGGGANPITGVSFRVSKHTDLLNDGNGNLASVYNVDTIHENNTARSIIASGWREILNRVGYLSNELPINTNNNLGFIQAGDVILNASSTNYSTLVGKSAGAALLSTGLYNTAVGYQALSTATSSVSNTAVGYYSLSFNAGSYNTANGFKSLYFNSYGSSNTATGYQALSNNTTGSDNTAYGVNALFFNTTGTQNTANGSAALLSNTTGFNNTASGQQSLYSNTTGYYNTAYGYNSLQKNVTGIQNTADGVFALRYGTSTIGVTALGYNAGVGQINVSNYNSTQDTYMTFLGYQASRDVTVPSSTTLTNGTAIGYNATVGGSNMVVLGGTGSYGVNVGIGTTSPLAKLDILNTLGGSTPLFSIASSTNGAGTSTALYIAANGNVGIGTTNTGSSKLSVVGLTNNSSTNYLFNFQNSDNSKFLSMKEGGEIISNQNIRFNGGFGIDSNSSAASIILATGGSGTGNITLATANSGTQRSIVLSPYGIGNTLITNGNVGIGTTSPLAKLDILSTLGDQTPLFSIASSTNGLGTSTALYVANNGRVGIGTAVPGSNLEITGTDGATNVLRITSNTNSSVYSFLTTTATGMVRSGSGANFSIQTSGTYTGSNGGITFNPLLTEAMRITGAGNVGIGTTSPLAKLDILNTLGGSTPLFSIASSTNGLGTTTAFYVAANGNVGVGTMSPNYKLEVNGDINIPDGSFYRISSSGSAIMGSASNGTIIRVGTSDSKDLSFYAGGADKMFIQKTTGNVGIGTTSPSSQLTIHDQVLNNPNSSRPLLVVGNRDDGISLKMEIRNVSNSAAGVLSSIRVSTGATGSQGGQVYSSNFANSNFGIVQGLNFSGLLATDSIGFRTGAAALAGTASSPQMIIDPSGKIGLGTTTPLAKLDILNTLGGQTPLFSIASSTNGAGTSTAFYIAANGNVGIGTNSPNGLLELNNSNSDFLKLRIHTESVSQNTYAGIGFGVDTVSEFMKSAITHVRQVTNGGGDLAFLVNGTTGSGNVTIADEKMRIQGSTGNIGIGTTSPMANLTLSGTTNGTENVFRLNLGTSYGGASSNRSLVIGPNSINSIYTNNQGVSSALFLQPFSAAYQTKMVVGTTTLETSVVTTMLVYGADSTNSSRTFATRNSNNTETFTVLNDGRVGIGTTTPVKKLDIYNSGILIEGSSGVESGIYSARFIVDAGVSTSHTLADFRNSSGSILTVSGSKITAPFASTTALNVAGTAYLPGNGIWNSSGNVGIGTSSPLAKLDILSTLGDQTPLFSIASSTNGTGTSTALYVAANGNVGIGTTTPDNLLTVGSTAFRVNGAGNVAVAGEVPGLNGWELRVGGDTYTSGISNAGLALTTSGYIRANGNSNSYVLGNLGVGTTTPGKLLTVGSDVPVGAVAHFQNSSGSCYINPTTTSLDCSSDIRLKKNIDSLSSFSGLKSITKLRPVTYNWNTESASSSTHTGFIAQEVLPIYPDLVSDNSDGFYTMNYAGLTPYLVKAVQELNANNIGLSDALSTTTLNIDSAIATLDITKLTLASTTLDLIKLKTSTDNSLLEIRSRLDGMDIKIDALASTTESVVSSMTYISSQPFIEKVAESVKNLIASAGEWVISKISATLAVFTNVETKNINTETASVSQGLMMTDHSTGEVYCVMIDKGEWSKVRGACETTRASATTTSTIATSTSYYVVATPTPMIVSTPTSTQVIAVTPTPTPVSGDSTSGMSTSTPNATSTPVVTSIATSTSDILSTSSATSTPAVSGGGVSESLIPSATPVITPAPEVSLTPIPTPTPTSTPTQFIESIPTPTPSVEQVQSPAAIEEKLTP